MRAFTIFFAALMAVSTASADSRNGKWDALIELNHTLEGGLILGALFPSTKHELYNNNEVRQMRLKSGSIDLGLRIAYLPIPLAGIELEGTMAPTRTTKTDRGATVTNFRGHALAQYPWKVTPFVLAGVGAMGIKSGKAVLGSDQDLVSHIGLGAKYAIKDYLLVRFDGRQIHAPRARSNGFTTHYELLAGVSGTFGFGNGKGHIEMPTELPDTDGDGIKGDADKCPDIAGDPPDGCPSGDMDNDGINDFNDKCPTEKEDMDGFEDDDGCPDLDNDGDGIPDDVDKCPNESELFNGVDDEDGCPEDLTDTDGDGIADLIDKCKDEPEDKDGFEDADGCPDPDNDGDGVADAMDACPDKPGPSPNMGCPDIDTDNDGVVDRLDNCPTVAGTAENYGCQKRQLVKLTAEKIEILSKVFFATGKAEIRKRSFKLLDNIAAVLNSHPEIKRLRVEGHTDNTGTAERNKTLSQSRAEAVVRYLEEQGVTAGRIEPTGYGLDKPIMSNATRRGRASNRRVEFTILEIERKDSK